MDERLSAPLSVIKGAGPRRAALLEKLGLRTIYDLLFFFPRKYEDRRNVRKISALVPGAPSVVIAQSRGCEARALPGRGRRLIKCRFSDGSGLLDAVWFNIKGLENSLGDGTFRAQEGCHPFCGEIGALHTEKEIRIETVLPAFRKGAVMQALLSVHPYEEPAFDFYLLENRWEQVGSGVVGELPEEEDEMSFLQRIKELFQVGCVKHSPLTGRPIREVALCGGSGAFLINDAINYGADIFITGEAKYNDFYDVEDRILLATIGHYESEVCTKEIFYSIISRKFPTFALHLSNVNSNPVKYL